MSSDFGVSSTVVNLSVAFYMLSMAIFPLWVSLLLTPFWSVFCRGEKLRRRQTVHQHFLGKAITDLLCLQWSSFSETLGRRTIYLCSFFLNIIFTLLSGLSVNITMLIVFRILAGGAAASVQAVGAGTIADIWETRERGRAMGMFYLGPLMGPLLAPIIGGE
jgi:MFS family permease